MDKVKFNLGSGHCPLDNYINVDIHTGRQAYPLECPDGSVDEIRASHLLEHFSHQQTVDVLKNWVQKLKPGGLLFVAVPDFEKIVRQYIESIDGHADPVNVLGYLMGGQVDQYDYHKTLLDESSLTRLMQAVGLEGIKRWKSSRGDSAELPISLNLVGHKPEQAELTSDGSQIEAATVVPPDEAVAADAQPIKISGVMSLPRLAFTDNMHAVYRSLVPLGISFTKGCGVFWGHVLTRLIEKHLHDGTEWLLTMDYDTWFTKDHVQRLCQLMAEYDYADAIVPLQIKREGEGPMFGQRDEHNQVVCVAPLSQFTGHPLTEIRTGHFGLTLFRMSRFHNLKRPWFKAVPDDKGGWGDGRIEEDVYFWNNWHDCGHTAYLANEVSIGHCQLMCTFPDTAQNGFAPMHLYTSDVERGKYPEHCNPKIEVLK